MLKDVNIEVKGQALGRQYGGVFDASAEHAHTAQCLREMWHT
jgi:hypothetical protein